MSQVALPGMTTITSPGTKRWEEIALHARIIMAGQLVVSAGLQAQSREYVLINIWVLAYFVTATNADAYRSAKLSSKAASARRGKAAGQVLAEGR